MTTEERYVLCYTVNENYRVYSFSTSGHNLVCRNGKELEEYIYIYQHGFHSINAAKKRKEEREKYIARGEYQILKFSFDNDFENMLKKNEIEKNEISSKIKEIDKQIRELEAKKKDLKSHLYTITLIGEKTFMPKCELIE